MKIIYTEGDFLEGGYQVIAYAVNADNITKSTSQKHVRDVMPDAMIPYDGLYNDANAEPPHISDVIWTQTSGNRWIAHCIVFDETTGELNEDAMRKAMRSVGKKCVELEQNAISMDLFGCDDETNWNNVYPIIEEEIQEQVFVHVALNEDLLKVIDTLPGQTHNFPDPEQYIRFAKVDEA